MLDAIKALFQPAEAESVDSEAQLRLACAALMIEVATIDRDFSDEEQLALAEQLRNHFSLSEDETRELCELAKQERHDATSLHQFTRAVNEHCDHSEKYRLLESMWHIAYADGELDKYEEHIIRRAADLMHLAHSDFIKAKLSAKSPQ